MQKPTRVMRRNPKKNRGDPPNGNVVPNVRIRPMEVFVREYPIPIAVHIEKGFPFFESGMLSMSSEDRAFCVGFSFPGHGPL
jgi:hypothetical protein